MRKRIFNFSFALVALISLSLSADAQSRSSPSASEVNGTFEMNFKGKFKDQSNQIKILALGGGRIRVAMDLLYPYTLGDGSRTANLGDLEGEVAIDGDVSDYESNEFGNCKITIKFVKPGTIKVTQKGTDADCGFGHSVTSNGTYRKVSGKKPKFERAK